MRLGGKARLGGNDHGRTGQALGDVIVGLPDKAQLHAWAGEGAERLAGGAAEPEVNGSAKLAPLDCAREAGAEGPIGGREREAIGSEAGLPRERQDEPSLEGARLAMADRATRRRRR
ncbi:MAG: hypothetical protein NVS9B8_14960 [Candidatus Limnocylindrales bacterium]